MMTAPCRIETRKREILVARGYPLPSDERVRAFGISLVAVAFAVTMVFGGMALSQQSGYQVVVHPTVSIGSVAKKDLARFFLKRKKTWPDGSVVVPVDLKPNAAARSAFSEQVLGKSPDAVEAFWNGQVFSGKESPPASVGSDSEVISLVSRTPGAVGYVSTGASLAGVKVLAVID